jgi:hypothetical protein
VTIARPVIQTVIRAARAWDAFWFGRESALPLAALRVAFGAYLGWFFARHATRVTEMFSRDGIQSPFLIGPGAVPSPPVAYAIYVATLAAIAAFAAGVRTRVTTPLVLAAYLYYWLIFFAADNTAFDRLNLIVLVVLCFAEIDRAFVPWRRARAAGDDATTPDAEPTVLAWAPRLLRLQVALLYLGAGLWKLVNRSWHDGRVLQFNFIGPYGTDLGRALVGAGLPDAFFTAMTWSVIAFELTAPVALYLPRVRVPFMVVGVLFHLGNCTLLDIPEFMNTVVLYTLFIPAAVWRMGRSSAPRTSQHAVATSSR